MSDKLRKLTGKNPKEFTPVAFNVINNPDVDVFAELVEHEDYLFDFVKQNVANRLNNACNSSNYLNLLKFLKYYSPSYEEFIVSNLAKFADEDLTDKMLEIFENGNISEKTYCAKFFSCIQDPLAIDLLKANSYSENSALRTNCAATLAILGDEASYKEAITKLHSNDEFEKLDAVEFLVAYGKKDAVADILEVMKTSSLAENIAGEIVYLTDLTELLKENSTNGLFVLNSIINGLGEILSLGQVFDFQIYEAIEYLKSTKLTSEIAVVLLNAKDKFNTITENNEYLYDETKEVKQEVADIKALLASFEEQALRALVPDELKSDSLFVYTALEFSSNPETVRSLLDSTNQTVILKALETLKTMNRLTNEDKNIALNSISNEDIKSIILAI